MREKFLTTIGKLSANHPWWMLLFISVLTIVSAQLASRLTVNSNMTEMFPKTHPMVQEFNLVMNEFNGSASVIIAVEGEEKNMIAFAEDVADEIINLDEWIVNHASQEVIEQHKAVKEKEAEGRLETKAQYYVRVDYKTPQAFIRDHGLMLLDGADLQNTGEMFVDPNLPNFITHLNNSLEKEYIQSEEKLSSIQKERNAVSFLDGIESWVDYLEQGLYSDSLNAQLAADAVTIGTPYIISPDRSMLLMMAMPTFNMMEMDHLMPGVNGLEELTKSYAQKHNVHVGLAGSIVMQRDELKTQTEDSMTLTLLALFVVLVLFIITFRMLAAPLLAILNLIIGILWALGVASLLVPYLNLFTVMMSVVLVGLGIDFSIHIISLYSELTNKGVDHKQAIIETLAKTGSGIITGGFTTAGAFLTLLISRSTAMKEFGLVCGIGLIVIMFSTLLCLPIFLTIKNKIRKKKSAHYHDVAFNLLGTLGNGLSIHWKPAAIVLFGFTVIMAILSSKMTFDYNFLNMEPVGLESVEMNEKIIDKFNMSTEATVLTSKSLEENYELTQKAKEMSTIRLVESITEFLPAPQQQRERQLKVDDIHQKCSIAVIRKSISTQEWQTIKDELFRLEANIIEMQDMAFTGGQDLVDEKASRLVGNPDKPEIIGKLTTLLGRIEDEMPQADRLDQYQQNYAEAFQQNVLHMSNSATITLDMLPPIVKDKYVSKKGDLFLITTYPGRDVWNFDFLFSHTKELQSISERATGSVPLFYFALKFLGADGRNASLLAIFVIFVFLLVDFRSFKNAALAMIPLVFGVIWMLGIMKLAGMQFTIMNILGVPIIIGIGIDDGVHVLHRLQIEGKGAVRRVMASTGKAVVITSLTTMLSFGSLIFARYRGFGMLGSALFIGVGACLLATLLVLPVSLKLFRK